MSDNIVMPTGTIYEDVAALTQRVAALEAQLEDSGWIVLPLATGVEAYSAELTPKYRKVGKAVYLTGVVKGITAANAVLGTLPEGFRPTRQMYFMNGASNVSGNATFFNGQVNADGSVRITTHSEGVYIATNYLRLNGSFLID